MLRAIMIAVAAAILVSPASAASFNCKRAKLPAEVAVCTDPTLSAADDQLARQFAPLIGMAAPDDVKAIKKEEDSWLASRNACGGDKQCILGRYRERLQQLADWQRKIAAAPSGAEATPAVDPNAASIAPVAPTVAPSADDDNGNSN
jgi:uncharacterized protein